MNLLDWRQRILFIFWLLRFNISFINGQCLLEDALNPKFSSAISESTNLTLESTLACEKACRESNFVYAGVEDSSFCLCGNDITGLLTGTCLSLCLDGKPCGGDAGDLTVIELEKPADDGYISLAFVVNVTTLQIDVPLVATLNASGNFSVNWGDGTDPILNDTDHTYILPGIFVVTAFLENSPPVSMSSTVTVHEPPDVSVECPDLLELSVPQECNVTLSKQGFDYELSWGMVNSTSQNMASFKIPSQSLQVFGSRDVSGVSSESTITSPQMVVLANSKTITEGQLIRVLAKVLTSPTYFAVYTVTPKCSADTYCGVIDKCISSCPSPGDPFTCGTELCSPSSICKEATCTGATEALVGEYSYELLTTIEATGMDFDFELLEPVWVPAGVQLAIGCIDSAADCTSAPATIFERLPGVQESGDHILDTSSGLLTPLNANLLVQLVIRNHPVETNVTLLCETATPVPVSLVPTPFDATTEEFVFKGDLNLTMTISSEVFVSAPVTHSSAVLCQQEILPPTLETDVWMKFGEPFPLPVTFEQGSPLFSIVDIDGNNFYSYHDDALGGWEMMLSLEYANEGLFLLTGNTSNALGFVLYNASIHVVPPVTDTWTLAFTCPCLDWENGFPFSLTFPSAPNPPWNASMDAKYESILLFPNELIDFGTYGAGGTAAPLEITKTAVILQKGVYQVTVILENEVSSTTIMETVTVEEAIRDVSVDMFWDNSGQIIPGLGGDNNIFLTNHTVFFYPKCRTGTPDKWNLTIVEYDEAILTNSASENITRMFTEHGELTIIMSGYNAAQGWVSSPPITIKIVSKIMGFFLTDDKIIKKPNEEKIILGDFIVFTPLACIVIDYGDGSDHETFGHEPLCKEKYPDLPYKGPASAPVPMPHIYKLEGSYTVTAMAFDSDGEFTEHLVVIIGDIPCTMPTVNIVNGIKLTDAAPKYFQSDKTRVESQNSFECTGGYNTKLWWTIQEIDVETGVSIRDVAVENILPSWNFAQITIPGRFLTYGTYRLTFYLNLLPEGTNFNLKRSDYCFITIIPSPLRPVIISGSPYNVKRSFGQMLNLYPGSLSYDPDFPDDRDLNITMWCCQKEPNEETIPFNSDGITLTKIYPLQEIPASLVAIERDNAKEGCFGEGPGTLLMPETNNIQFNTASFMYQIGKFQFLLEVQKGSRISSTSVTIEVVSEPPPTMEIICNGNICTPISYGLLINPTKRLALLGNCLSDCSTEISYEWSITTRVGLSVDESSETCETASSTDGGAVIDMAVTDCKETFMIGKTEQDLVVHPVFFANNKDTDEFIFRLTGTTIEGKVGFTEVLLRINKPPANGYCELLQNSGEIFLTDLPVVCSNWIDPEDHPIKSYTYYYILKSDQGSSIKNIASTSKASLNLIMPIGSFDVYVDISDIYDAATPYHLGNITVENNNLFDINNITEQLKYYGSIGDETSLGMALIALASIRNDPNSDFLSLEPSAIKNLTEEELMARIAQIADMNNEQLKLLLNTSDFSTIEQLNSGSSILQSMVQGVFDNPLAAYTIDMDTKETSLDIIEKMTDQIPSINVSSPYDLEPFISNSLDTMSGLMVSINEVLATEDVVPPSDQRKAGDWDYDTQIDDINAKVPESSDLMVKQNVYDTTKSKSMEQLDQIFRIIDKINKEVQELSVPGEVVKVHSPNGASILITKIREHILQNGLTLDASVNMNASVKFPPKFCPSHYEIVDTDCNQILGMKLVIWPCITHVYPDSSKVLSNLTRVLDIEVDIDYKTVDVSNETTAIIVNIPRDKGMLPEAVYVNISEAMHDILPFVYHAFNISNENSAYTIEIIPLVESLNNRMVFMIDYERMPTPSKYMELILIKDLPITTNINGSNTYSYFVGSNENDNKTGRFFVAVGLLKSNIPTKPLPTKLQKDDFDPEFDIDYMFRVYLSGCYFFHNSDRKWSGSGVEVIKATPRLITCGTIHLTPFGSGFVPTPNSINFDYIFANLGFIDNLTLYVVLIIITSLYIIMMIWGHWMDRKDFKLRGVIPLPDNDPMDKYLYELTFYTGPDSDASTDSNINIILSGDYGETEIRSLPPANYKLYRRFGVNSFVMATPKPLGPINYLRVFHDNTGEPPLDSWQLEMVVVRDLQLPQKFIFDTNSWLAFDRDDGKIDKIFTPNEGIDEKTFSQNIYIRANKSANQDHMWMAMFLRPNGSRFGRKERISVCAAFLYLCMLTSALWYDSTPDSSMDSYFRLGPFTLSGELLITGMCILFIAYPFVYLLTLVFKRARPKNLKKCRALQAIEKQKAEQLLNQGIDESDAETKSKIGIIPRKKAKPKDQSPVKCFPWWTRIVAWLLVFISIGASLFFVWSYGIMWGEIKTVKWFSSFILCFAISILISQWLKVFCQSCCLSTLCKTDLSAEDIDCDEELPQLKQDEEWSHPKLLDASKRRKVHSVEGVDIENPEVDAIRTRMMKEREIKFVLRAILWYCIFLAILIVLVNDRTDYNGYLLQNQLTNSFIKKNHLELDFSKKIITTSDWWKWAKNVILQEIRAQRDYSNKPPYGLRGFLDDRANRIMGFGVIRQIRSKRYNCAAPSPLDQTIPHCSGSRGIITEESMDFCAQWTVNETFTDACKWGEFKYKSASELGTFAYTGKLSTYSGGGYVFNLSGSQDILLKRMDDLQKNHWVDQNSRALILEFSVYNANVNLFCICNIVAELNAGGGVVPKWRFEPIRLIQNSGISGFITTVCQILFLISIIIFTLRELWQMKKQKLQYFASYWNIAEIFIILVSYLTIALYFYRGYLTTEALNIFNETKGNGYVRMDSAAFVDQFYLYCAAFIVFLSALKLIKLLQFNKRMDVLALTIKKCWDELKIFFIAFGIVFFAFSCLFFFMFTGALEEFAQILPAIQTSFKMMMGKFDFEEMKQENALSPLLFFLFSLCNSMILINIMLTIILQAFNEVKVDLEKKENRLDVIDSVWCSFRQFIRVETLPKIHVEPVKKDKEEKTLNDYSSKDPDASYLPDKVGQLLHYINQMYFDGQLDLNDVQAKKSLMEGNIPFNFRPSKDPTEMGGKSIVSSED